MNDEQKGLRSAFSDSNGPLPIRQHWEMFSLKKWLQLLMLLSAAFMGIGLVGFYLEGTLKDLSLGMWLGIIWACSTFPMLYYGHYRIYVAFAHLWDITNEDKLLNLVGALKDAHASLGGRWWLGYGGVFAAISLSVFYPFYETVHPSLWLDVWGLIFFIGYGFMGGYGVACVISFLGLADRILGGDYLTPAPFHPDRFMGLGALGTLAVVNALLASSGSLLLPLILESNEMPEIFRLPGYVLFGIILILIITAFVFPIFKIRDYIEIRKFIILKEHEQDYQALLTEFRESHKSADKDELQLLQVERVKFEEIHLFPFETKMVTQFVASIILPFIILYLQVTYK